MPERKSVRHFVASAKSEKVEAKLILHQRRPAHQIRQTMDVVDAKAKGQNESTKKAPTGAFFPA